MSHTPVTAPEIGRGVLPTDRLGFVASGFRNYLRVFQLGGAESRSSFWRFILVGGVLGIAATTLIGAVIVAAAWDPVFAFGTSVGWKTGSPIPDSVRAAGDRAVVTTTWTLAIVGVFSAWAYLSLAAATRRRLTDAGADTSLAWIWLFLPVPTVIGGVIGFFFFGFTVIPALLGAAIPSALLVVIVLSVCCLPRRERQYSGPTWMAWIVGIVLPGYIPAVIVHRIVANRSMRIDLSRDTVGVRRRGEAIGLLAGLPLYLLLTAAPVLTVLSQTIWKESLDAWSDDVAQAVVSSLGSFVYTTLPGLLAILYVIMWVLSAFSGTFVRGYTKRSPRGRVVRVRGHVRDKEW
jgi:uncharacterized membrane protein YhaH (DUF805 family)